MGYMVKTNAERIRKLTRHDRRWDYGRCVGLVIGVIWYVIIVVRVGMRGFMTGSNECVRWSIEEDAG